ncbi:mechanosensitive ion channel family protein [Lactobacillus sp. ESL0684]|uniref:mechanosensitive ion channel family protein n=1 Tax=unclassified Lactobacillus TaxID=2620435 RepID=UPI0023F86569|nr:MULTISPECIES: mechanosensitive ion channel family protein [unclassified Lactobacillus]WEV40186.1 mechanosensitive ion channel family protein [Lactobacillus sp. ESL0681]WEV43292.1 mechanosensitive ion channel family protein [Lactobacillus sp. ESL0684]
MNNTFNFNQNFLKINWDKVGEHLGTIVWQLVLSTIVFYLIDHFGKKIINHYLNHSKRKQTKRTRTVTALINSIFQYTVIFFYLFGVLSILGIPVGTLLASAGIFSLAIGMGAQGFVSDLVNGFFILSEDQFDVGDVVQINNQTGVVIQLGLRTTRLKGTDGSIIYIPNRNISVVQNVAHGGIGLDLELQLNADNDFAKVYMLIKQANQEIKLAKKTLVQGPKIVGITKQTAKTVSYVVHFQVKPGQEQVVQNRYLAEYLKILQANQITLAG